MLLIRPTKSLIKEIQPQLELVDLPVENDFFSWHTNSFILNRKKHIIFMNDRSRLSITVSGLRSNQYKDISGVFLSDLKDYLAVEGVQPSLIDLYLGEKSDVRFANTNNRSVIGTITESIKLMEYMYSGGTIPELNELNMDNNRIIYKPIDYNKPINVFKEQLEKSI